ncbi:MAG TPA: hypothetical protein VNO70_14550 [Blastocatellia bacterium]|nr:hypothetical protein [Blastocatellia bacterium]
MSDYLDQMLDKRKRIWETERELGRLKAEGGSLSEIAEQEYKLRQILLEGRVLTTFDELNDKTARLNIIDLKIRELSAEIEELQRQREELLKEGRPPP